MKSSAKLTLIKIIHTLIWLFFNFVILYMLYAAISNRLDIWLWLGFGLILTEGVILLIFKLSCPLTVAARRYSDSTADNFDIYLPIWLARNNKLIYTLIFAAIVLITLFRLAR